MKKSSLLYAAAFSITLLFIIGILVYAGLTFSIENFPLSMYGLSDLGSEWTQKIGRESAATDKLPADLDYENNVILIQNTIPAEVDRNAVLVVKLRYQKLRAFVDDNLIYEAGYKDRSSFGHGFGFQLNFIPILKQYEGKKISLEYFSPIPAERTTIDSILFGNEAAAFIHIFKYNLPLLFLCFSMFLVSIFFFVISIMLQIKFPHVKFSSSIYLGLFFFLTAFWLLTECEIMQFFITHRTVSYLLSFYSFMSLTVPFLLFINEIFAKKYKAAIYAFCLLFAINMVVCNLLYILNVFELIQTIVSTHLLIILCLIYVTTIIFEELFRKNKEIHDIAIGIAVLALSSFVSIISYYFLKLNYFKFIAVGILIFSVFMGISALKMVLSLINTSISASTYKMLAYTDSMTGLKNRASFSEALDSMHSKVGKYNTLALMIFDLDNLKPVNDTMGHIMGDELIKGVAECLSKAFSDFGQSFRIGGDEFAVLSIDKTEDEIIEKLKLLDCCIDKYNLNHTGKIALSLGFEFCGVQELNMLSIYDIFNRADAKMYEHKKSKGQLRSI